MKLLVLGLCFGAWIGESAEPVTRISLSQQFVVRGLPLDQPLMLEPAGNSDWITLEPGTTVVTCERIKQMLLQELSVPDQWHGKIYIKLFPKRLDEEKVSLRGDYHPEGWVYFLEMPERIQRRRFLTVLVQVLLFEMANRGAKEIPAELPPWLGEGFAAYLEAKGGISLFAEPFSRRVETQKLGEANKHLRDVFKSQPPLDLDQLNLTAIGADSPAYEPYRASAQLLVSELLRLEGGSMRLVEMIRNLHANLNWQTSFVRAYQDRFPRLIDFDKWWTLTVAHFLGREPSRELSMATALEQFSEVLSIPLDVIVDSGRISHATRGTLQQVITEWEPARLDPLISRKLFQLEALEWRIPAELAALSAKYRETLMQYRAQRNAAAGPEISKNQLPANAKIALKRALRQLDELDRVLDRLKAEEAALAQSRKPVPSPAPPGPSAKSAP